MSDCGLTYTRNYFTTTSTQQRPPAPIQHRWPNRMILGIVINLHINDTFRAERINNPHRYANPMDPFTRFRDKVSGYFSFYFREAPPISQVIPIAPLAISLGEIVLRVKKCIEDNSFLTKSNIPLFSTMFLGISSIYSFYNFFNATNENKVKKYLFISSILSALCLYSATKTFTSYDSMLIFHQNN